MSRRHLANSDILRILINAADALPIAERAMPPLPPAPRNKIERRLHSLLCDATARRDALPLWLSALRRNAPSHYIALHPAWLAHAERPASHGDSILLQEFHRRTNALCDIIADLSGYQINKTIRGLCKDAAAASLGLTLADIPFLFPAIATAIAPPPSPHRQKIFDLNGGQELPGLKKFSQE